MRIALIPLLALIPFLSVRPGPAAEDAPAGEAEEAEAAPQESPLAGRTYAITITSSDGETSEDVLRFESANLASETYAASRFVPGPVRVTGKDGDWRFHAVLASPRGAEAVFDGTITGDAVEGTVVAGVKGGGEKATFSGKRQP